MLACNCRAKRADRWVLIAPCPSPAAHQGCRHPPPTLPPIDQPPCGHGSLCPATTRNSAANKEPEILTSSNTTAQRPALGVRAGRTALGTWGPPKDRLLLLLGLTQGITLGTALHTHTQPLTLPSPAVSGHNAAAQSSASGEEGEAYKELRGDEPWVLSGAHGSSH